MGMDNLAIETQNNENVFEYTYSAKTQEEVEKIRKKYLPRQENKLEQIKELDKSVERPGTIAAIILGVIGTLTFGTGLSLVLVWKEIYFVEGVIVGCIGLALSASAYPVYWKITERKRKKIAPQILELCEEILK